MPVFRLTCSLLLWCALLTAGCTGTGDNCPQGTVVADPQEIPAGTSQTSISIDVTNPFPDNGIKVLDADGEKASPTLEAGEGRPLPALAMRKLTQGASCCGI